MNYKELYEQAEEAMMQEVAKRIREDIKELGEEYWGEIKPDSFDAISFSSDLHYNDENRYDNRLCDLILYKDGTQIDTSDVDILDLIYELEKEFPRLINISKKIYTIK